MIILTFVLSSRRRPRQIRSLTRRRLGVTYGIARWGVIATLAIVAMILLGVDLRGIWSTVVAVLSLVAIGFVAMWSILSHMLASLLIVLFRPFDVGDQIEIVGDDPVLGEVHDLNFIYTTLRTPEGVTLQIPNNLFFQKVLKRHSASVPLSSTEVAPG
jgi:small-conductance mechanosensitive channel